MPSDRLFQEVLGFCGAFIIRRIVGIAGVADLRELPDLEVGLNEIAPLRAPPAGDLRLLLLLLLLHHMETRRRSCLSPRPSPASHCLLQVRACCERRALAFGQTLLVQVLGQSIRGIDALVEAAAASAKQLQPPSAPTLSPSGSVLSPTLSGKAAW